MNISTTLIRNYFNVQEEDIQRINISGKIVYRICICSNSYSLNDVSLYLTIDEKKTKFEVVDHKLPTPYIVYFLTSEHIMYTGYTDMDNEEVQNIILEVASGKLQDFIDILKNFLH